MKCTHPCNSKNPTKPICPLAITEELAEKYFPNLCQSSDSIEDDPDQFSCEWFEAE